MKTRRCANCGNEPEEEFWVLCGACMAIPVCDGSVESWRAWRAWFTIVNGVWNTEDMLNFADSPEIQKFIKQLIAAMNPKFRSLFVLKEARKVIG